MYRFIWGDWTPIENIADIFKSQYNHYFQNNGRAIVHSILQFFDCITGKIWFNIANTVVFLLMVYLIPRTIQCNKQKNSNYVITSIFIILLSLFLYPFKECFLWMTGSCNYLWATVFWLIFHRVLSLNIKQKKYYPLFFLLGIIAGWTHEGIILGAAAGYFFHYLFHKEELSTPRCILLIGLFIGICFLIFSPASWSRAQGMGSLNLSDFYRYFWTFVNLKDCYPLHLLILLVLYLRYKKKIKFSSFIQENIFYITAILSLLVFILFLKTAYSRSHYGINFFSLLLLTKCLTTYFNFKESALTVLNLFVLVGSIIIINLSSANYREYLSLINQIQQTGKEGGIIKTNEIKLNRLEDNLICKMLCEYDEFSVYFRREANEYYAKYLQKDYLIFLPEKFINEITDYPAKYDSFPTPTDFPFYAKRLKRNEEVSSVTFILKDTAFEELPFYIRPFASKLSRYTLHELNVDKGLWDIISFNNERYLLVRKNWMLDDRLQEIKIN